MGTSLETTSLEKMQVVDDDVLFIRPSDSPSTLSSTTGIFSRDVVSRDVELFATRLGIFVSLFVQLFSVVSVTFSNTMFFVLSVIFSDARVDISLLLFLTCSRKYQLLRQKISLTIQK